MGLALLAASTLGCPPGEATRDGSLDARPATSDAHERDALACDPTCSSTRERCCASAEGAPRCVDVSSDVANCGLCGFDCRALRRGDRCVAMQCSCGAFAIGCTGEDTSLCCPPAPDGRAERCANVGRDFDDCGGCGRVCDAMRANRCEAGQCQCGTDGSRCAGTPEDRCCLDRFDVASCVDTTRDDDHCGDCDVRCTALERCVLGRCVARRPSP